MTIGKASKGLLALLVLCALLLSACAKTEPEDPFEELMRTTTTETEVTVSYRLVVPWSCTAELYEEAGALAEEITRQTGRPCTLVYDRESVRADSEITEIWLGAVERAGVSERLKGFRGDDYVCCFLGEAILLGGNSDEATCAAIGRFRAEVLAAATADQLMHPYGGFEHKGTYTGIYLNGFELSDYRIFLPQAAEELSPLAQTLRERLEALGEYDLQILTMEEDNGIGKGLYLELGEQATMTATLTPLERGIRLSAAEPYGISLAVSRLLTYLEAGKTEESYRLTLTQTEAISYTLPQYRVAWLCGKHVSSLTDITAMAETIRTHTPELVVVSELQDGYESRLADYLSDYRILSDESGTAAPIYTKTSAIKLRKRQTEGTLTLSVCRAEGEDGFTLVAIHGALTENVTVSLSELIGTEAKRVVVLQNTTDNTGTLTVSDAASYKLLETVSTSYETAGERYVLRGYSTQGAIGLRSGTMQTADGYAELILSRLSVFS